MQRSVLIILPAYKGAVGYLNVLRPQVDKSFWSMIQNSKVIVENENLRISVINDFSINDNIRGSRFHNILIHDDCYISDEVYCGILAPMMLTHRGEEIKIQHFEDNVEAYIVKYLLRLGEVETEDEYKRYNFIKDFTDTPDDKK